MPASLTVASLMFAPLTGRSGHGHALRFVKVLTDSSGHGHALRFVKVLTDSSLLAQRLER